MGKSVEGELMPRISPSREKSNANLVKRIKGDPNSPGRKPGTPNKVTREVKDVIARCFDNIGGEAAFAHWARGNKDEFYKIYAKLLPIRLQADMSKQINIYVSHDDTKLL